MRRINLSKSLLAAVALSALAACPDAEGAWDSFLERTEDVRIGGGDADLGCPGLTDISGTGLMFLVVSGPLGGDPAAAVPVFLRAEITNWKAAGDGATFDIDMFPLSVSSGVGAPPCTDLWTALPTPITKKNVPVDACGIFHMDFDMLTVSGCGNPLSGSDIVTQPLNLTGATLSDERACGFLEGFLASPLTGDFDKGLDKFAIELLADGAAFPDPAALTARFTDELNDIKLERPDVSCDTGAGGSGGSGGTGG